MIITLRTKNLKLKNIFICIILTFVGFSAFSSGSKSHSNAFYSKLNDSVVSNTIQQVESEFGVVFIIKYEGVSKSEVNVLLSGYGTQVSDSEGKATFSQVLSSDSIHYEIIADGYDPQSGFIVVVDQDVEKVINLSVSTYSVKFYLAIGTTPIVGGKVSFDDYGEKESDENGEAIFYNVTPDYSLPYTVDIPGYSLFTGILNVIDSDVVEEIIFSAPTFDVLFIVNLNSNPYEDVSVELEGYGSLLTNLYGRARFINVLPDSNITYTITSERHGVITGLVSVINEDVAERIDIVGANDIQADALKLYPNPSTGSFRIEVPNEGGLSIYNISGKMCCNYSVLKGLNFITTNELPAGIYFIKYSSEKSTSIQKLIIQ